jgi:serine phosphatase RsbU (regulator of sigma subunit)/tetratricopeptide (TPR) repeat protein
MRRLYSLVLYFLFCSLQLFSQKINTDSLKQILDRTEDPAKKIELLKILSKEYSSYSLDTTLEFANKGVSISRREKKMADLSQFQYDIGVAYSNNNDFDKANSYFGQSLKIRKALNDKNGVASIYFEIAFNFFIQTKYDSTRFYTNLVFNIAEPDENYEQLAKVHYLLARVNKRLGKNKEAFDDLEASLKFYDKTGNPDGKAKVLYFMGQINYDLGNYDEAIKAYNQSLQIRKNQNENNACALLNYVIGNALLAKGSFNEAMTSYQESLGFFDKTGNLEGVANCYNNIALVYDRLVRNEDFKQNVYYFKNALKYHNMALDMRAKTGNEYEMSNSMLNVANVYSRIAIDSLISVYGIGWEDSLSQKAIYKLLEKPLFIYEEALKIKKNINDKEGIAKTLTNLGNLYNRSHFYEKALSNLTRSVNINKELNNQAALMESYFEISRLHIKLRNYIEARNCLDLGTDLANKIGNKYYLKEFYQYQSVYFDSIGDCNKSMYYFKKFITLQDEVVSENNFKAIQEMNTKYETDKKDNDIKLQKSQIKNQKITIYATALVLLLIVGIAILLVKQNRERKRVNEKLEHQNEVITEQKQEITDSIRYASLIQTAAMPALSVVEKYFSGSFVFFRPRDIVSGDFFWLKEIHGKIIVVAADCTGHGVPGAFMSMLGISNLNNIVSTAKELHSDEILNELRKMIIISLNQTGKSGENKDGMDIALYIYDPDKKEIEYSGANNSLVLIRNGEILETKANKMPIGIHERFEEPFARNVIPVLPNDMIYSFSDGYADQFGGGENRKFMSGKMKKMFATIANEPIDVQYKTIEKANLDWRGDNFQVDDMIIIGIRI